LFLAEANNQGMICVLRAYQNPFGVTVASFWANSQVQQA
jgi:hypothetical protein